MGPRGRNDHIGSEVSLWRLVVGQNEGIRGKPGNSVLQHDQKIDFYFRRVPLIMGNRSLRHHFWYHFLSIYALFNEIYCFLK